MKSAKLELMSLGRIKSALVNPKKHDVEQLCSSIQRFGFSDFPTINETTGRLVEGHGRIEALKMLKQRKEAPPTNIGVDARGQWLVPVVRGLSWANDDEAQAYLLTHNQSTMGSGWDRSVGQVLADLRERNVNISGLGWRDDAIKKMLTQVRAHNRSTASEDAPPPPSDPVSRVGDVWTLGDHQLYCGSCEDLPRVLGDRRADLMTTDPPYGVDYSEKNEHLQAVGYSPGRSVEPIKSDALGPAGMSEFWKRVFITMRSVMRPGASFYLSGPSGDLLLLLLQALYEAGMPMRHTLVWAKDQLIFGRSDYHYQHELIFYGWIEGAGHHRNEDRTQSTLWEIPRPRANPLHPTQKPTDFYRRMMTNSSDPGDLVIEPFAGSGTALVVAEELGRICVASELSPAYCDVIVQRWEEQSGGKASRVTLA